ncbi:MAG TPA: LysR substrate-binding domain-containing protein [Burkholderiales bacterium]|nr:LysR substrate-binding domain-containing protein [Burkholderiales bacterium]
MHRHFDPLSLRLFIAVCEEQNIARAAEREAIVPSAISKRMAALEQHAGVALLSRKRRGIKPTPAGEVLLRQARDILGSMERMHAELREFAAGVHGSIRVMASLSALSEFLPDDVAGFLAAHRTVRVSLDERVSSEIVRGVREGAAELGVCWGAGELAGLETLPYRSDHLCAVVPAFHPLGRQKRIAFVDTLGFDHIEIRSGSIVQSTLRRAAAKARRAVRYRMQVSTFEAACRSVAAGLGIAMVPREAIGEALERALDLRLVPLADPWAERRFVICMRSREALSEAAGLLAAHLHERSKKGT